MQKRLCVQTNESSTQGQASLLPGIDFFLNPARNRQKEKIIKTKKDFAKNYFKESDMQTLYPELFRILWESTLSCFKENNKEGNITF